MSYSGEAVVSSVVITHNGAPVAINPPFSPNIITYNIQLPFTAAGAALQVTVNPGISSCYINGASASTATHIAPPAGGSNILAVEAKRWIAQRIPYTSYKFTIGTPRPPPPPADGPAPPTPSRGTVDQAQMQYMQQKLNEHSNAIQALQQLLNDVLQSQQNQGNFNALQQQMQMMQQANSQQFAQLVQEIQQLKVSTPVNPQPGNLNVPIDTRPRVYSDPSQSRSSRRLPSLQQWVIALGPVFEPYAPLFQNYGNINDPNFLAITSENLVSLGIPGYIAVPMFKFIEDLRIPKI